jgi:hypothetical protein
MQGLEESEFPDCQQSLTAAAAAIADKIDIVPDIFSALYQVMLLNRSQDFQGFCRIDPAACPCLISGRPHC